MCRLRVPSAPCLKLIDLTSVVRFGYFCWSVETNVGDGEAIANARRRLPFHSASDATDDVTASVDYFVRVLGFAPEFLWGDPPVYAGVNAGKAVIYFARDSEMARAIREHGLAPELFLWVTGVDSVYARHEAAGAIIVEALSDRPWGCAGVCAA